MLRKLVAIIGIILISNTLFADSGNDNARLCSKEDLIGEWILTDLQAGVSVSGATKDPWLQPYQAFRFYADGKMKHLTSTKPVTGEERKLYFPNMGFSNYEIDKNSVLKLTNEQWTRPIYLRCSYITADIELPNNQKIKKGNIILDSFGKDGKIVARYQLKKVDN